MTYSACRTRSGISNNREPRSGISPHARSDGAIGVADGAAPRVPGPGDVGSVVLVCANTRSRCIAESKSRCVK